MISFFKAILLIGVTFYIAAIYGSTAIALLCFAEAAFMLFSLGLVLADRAWVKCTLRVPISMACQEQKIRVFVNKERRGKPWRGKIRLQLTIQNTCAGGRKNIRQIINGDPQSAFNLILDKAGNYEISIRRMRVYDISGLFYLSRRSTEKASVVVLPTVCPVNVVVSGAVRNFIGDSEIYDTVRSGDDAGELLKLRAFREGDKMKDIHWKLSAKAGELIVKESSMPKACSTVLLLDSCGAVKRAGRVGRTDAYIRVAASLSFSMMDKDCPHYVAWYSRRFRDVVRMSVADEESFYELLVYLLQDFGIEQKEDVAGLYQEKYSAEVLLHRLLLNWNLELYEKDLLLARFDARNPEKSLAETELLL